MRFANIVTTAKIHINTETPSFENTFKNSGNILTCIASTSDAHTSIQDYACIMCSTVDSAVVYCMYIYSKSITVHCAKLKNYH